MVLDFIKLNYIHLRHHILVPMQEVWAKAVQCRRSLISIEPVKAWKKDQVKAVYDASSAKSFTGVLNEKHLIVVCSADLSLEDKSGWLNPPSGKSAQWDFFKDRCKYAVELAANAQVPVLAFLFDGRSREARRVSGS